MNDDKDKKIKSIRDLKIEHIPFIIERNSEKIKRIH